MADAFYAWLPLGEHYGWNATTTPVVSGDTTTFDQWRIMENWDEFRIGRGVQRFYPLGKVAFHSALAIPLAWVCRY